VGLAGYRVEGYLASPFLSDVGLACLLTAF
jgi:hypothetical protein